MIESRLGSVTWLLIIALALLCGGSFLAIRTALDEIPPLTSVSHRVLWAALALWGIVILRGIAIPTSPKLWGAFLIMGLLNNVIPFGLMAWGQLHVEVGVTAILNASTAIWGVLIAAVFFADEKLTSSRLIGVTIAFAGVVTVVGPGHILGASLKSFGHLAILAGTLSYALASSWARAYLGGVTPVVAAAGMLTGSTLVTLPLAVALEGPLTLSLEVSTWLAIGYYSLAGTALVYILYYSILSRAGAGLTLLVTLLIPPVTIVLGTWVRQEQLSWHAFLGFSVIALGLVIVSRGLSFGRRHAPRID